MAEERSNFIIELATAVPRRLTAYRGHSSNGQRGLVVAGLYYRAAIVEVPEIDEADTTAPLRVSVSIGNADNSYTDIYSDTANRGKRITISKVKFSGTWLEAIQPTITVSPWFEGLIARPALLGERLVLECVADTGRRGKSPRTKSRSLMVNATPLSAGQKLAILSRS